MQSLQTFRWLACLLILVLIAAGCDGGGEDEPGEPAPGTSSRVELALRIFGQGTVEMEGQHELTCDVPHICRAFVPENTNVIFRALPEAGYAVDGWEDCDRVSGSACTVTANQDRSVSVDFLSTEPLQFQDVVVMFDADRVDEIEDFDLDSGLMIMSADADVSDLDIGTVIVSNIIDPTREFDTYFLRRIRDIQPLAGSVTYIRTIQATLEDLIASGSLSSSLSGPLTSADVVASDLPEGVAWLPAPTGRDSALEPGMSAPRVAAVTSSLAIETCFTEDLCVKGTLDLEIDLDTKLDFRLGGLREFLLQVSLEPSANLTVTALKGVRDKREYQLPLNLYLLPITVGPVVLTPELTAKLIIIVGAGTNFEPRLTVGIRVTGGAHYIKGAGWHPIGKYEPYFDVEVGTGALEFVASAEAQIDARFATKLYGVAGPFVTALPYVGVRAFGLIPPVGSCGWDYGWHYGIRAGYGGDLKILKWGWDYTVTLLDARFNPGGGRNDCDQEVVDESPPSTPAGLTFSDVSENSLTLTWDESTDDGTYDVRYNVLRNPGEADSKVFRDVGETALHDRNLNAATAYCYQVIAVDAAGNESASSSSVCDYTKTRDTEPPTDPHVRLEVKSPTTISVTWDASSDNVAVDRYTVYEWPEGAMDPVSVTTTRSLSADITGLNPGTEYCFGVSAVDVAGNFSTGSDPVCATTLEAHAAAWRFSLACHGQEYNIEEAFDLVEDRAIPAVTVSVTGSGQDYDGTPLTYALTGTYTPQDMMLEGKINWSFEGGGRRTDTFTADLSTDDTGAIPMELVYPNPSTGGCDAVIRFLFGGGPVVAQSSETVLFPEATFSGQ